MKNINNNHFLNLPIQFFGEIFLLENVKTMDEFIFSIKDLNILESNKINLTDMKSINKGIKKFGYRCMKVRDMIYIRKF